MNTTNEDIKDALYRKYFDFFDELRNSTLVSSPVNFQDLCKRHSISYVVPYVLFDNFIILKSEDKKSVQWVYRGPVNREFYERFQQWAKAYIKSRAEKNRMRKIEREKKRLERAKKKELKQAERARKAAIPLDLVPGKQNSRLGWPGNKKEGPLPTDYSQSELFGGISSPAKRNEELLIAIRDLAFEVAVSLRVLIQEIQHKK